MPAPVASFDWDNLGQYKAAGVIPAQYPSNTRTFYSPEDKVHDVLVAILSNVRSSIVLNMYGFDDPQLDALIQAHASDPHMYVQISLDSTQAAGKAEAALLLGLRNVPGTNIAIGQSTAHAISHLKILIVDGLYVVSGSTNWSLSGEQKQDNVLTLTNDAIVASEARTILDRNHAAMLQQMAAKGST